MKTAMLAFGSFAVALAVTTVGVVVTADPESAEPPVQAESQSPAADTILSGQAAPGPGDIPTSAATDSAVADAAAAESPAADSAAMLVSESGSSDTADTTSTDEPTNTDAVLVETPSPVPTTPVVPVAAALPSSMQGGAVQTDDTDDEESIRQLARIFSAMRAEDAANVLKHLGNEEIVDILSFLNSRKAAGVLSALPDDRAAAVSRALMNGSNPDEDAR